jgi:hypothetical protein
MQLESAVKAVGRSVIQTEDLIDDFLVHYLDGKRGRIPKALGNAADSLRWHWNAEGKITPVVHNLALYSEDFTNWTDFRASGSLDTGSLVPEHLFISEFVEDGTASNTHGAYRACTIVAGLEHTFSIYVKANTRTACQIKVTDSGGTDGFYADFDIANVVAGTCTVIGSGTATGSSITSAGSDWYRISITGIVDASSTAVLLYFQLASAYTTVSYDGDGASSMYITGAQLVNFDKPMNYLPTTTAAKYGVRLMHDCTDIVHSNLITNNESLLRGTVENATTEITSVAPPSGPAITHCLREDASSSVKHGVSFANIAVLPATTFIARIRVKLGERYRGRFGVFAGSDSFYCTFNLVTETVSSVSVDGDGTAGTASITDEGNGWYLLAVSGKVNFTSSSLSVDLHLADNDGNLSYNGDGDSCLYYAGVELKDELARPQYTKTGDVSRTQLAPSAIRAEPPITNGFSSNFAFDNATWVMQSGLSASDADIDSPVTGFSLSKITSDGTTGGRIGYNAGATISTSGVYTISAFFKEGENATVGTGSIDFATDGAATVYNSGIDNCPNGVKRIWVCLSVTNAGTYFTPLFYPLTDGYAGITAGAFGWLGCAMVHSGFRPAACIPTTGATKTVTQDKLRFPYAITREEGSLLVDFTEVSTYSDAIIASVSINSDNMQMRFGQSTETTFYMQSYDNPSQFLFSGITKTPNTRSKMFAGWRVDNFFGAVGASDTSVDTSGDIPNGANMYLAVGCLGDYTRPGWVDIHKLAYWARKLPNGVGIGLTE